ncbi:MAG: DGQHR domain-containing protein [Sphingobacterium sp.]|jgi:DGQHR domain-containing protein|uniref:DGQHR domain-containing protein n=1 Tax=Sphingobacterium sp. TaxID=341027 RepID=UPI00284BAB04|nr:DGQHR domain-containing protein [Sphingobacterium sp.]MDR3009461.1 DGQHR domain-containing protein [Sphingobacterium sp.]
MNKEEIENFQSFSSESEKETALFFDSLGLTCISLCSKIKADDGSDITDIDGIFVDIENKIIIIYDDSIQKSDATSKIALFFTKCSQTKYEQQIYHNHPELPHYPIKILYIDKSRNRKKDNSRAGALEFSMTEHTAILYKDDFEYFKNLISETGVWAKNDLYNFLDIRLPNNHIEIDATKIYVGDTPAYIFASKPHEILRYAYVSRRRGNDKGYQRMIDFTRMNLIADKLVNGKISGFMNSILLNSTIKLEEKNKISKSHTPSQVKLIIPNHFSSCRVVDGQHRLLSFTKLTENQQSKYSIPVVLMDNLSLDEEKKIFLEINKNAKPVDPNLEYEIIGDINNWDENSEEFYTSLAVLTVKNISKSIVIKSKVFFGTVGEKKSDNITLKAFVDILKKYNYISENVNLFGHSTKSKKDIKFLSQHINEILLKAHEIITDKDFIISNRIVELLLGYAAEIIKKNLREGTSYEDIKESIIDEKLTEFFQVVNNNSEKLKDSKSYGGSSYKNMLEFILNEMNKEVSDEKITLTVTDPFDVELEISNDDEF